MSNSVCSFLISSCACWHFSFSLDSSSVKDFNSWSSVFTSNCKEPILLSLSSLLLLHVSKLASFSFSCLCNSATSSLLFVARDCVSSSSCLRLAKSFSARYNSSWRLVALSCFSDSSLFNSSFSSCAATRRSSNSEPCFNASNNSLSDASFRCWTISILDLILEFSSCRLLTSAFKVLFSALNISIVSSLFAKSLLWDSRSRSCSWTLRWRRRSSLLLSLPFDVNVFTCCSKLSLIFSIRWSCVSRV